MKGRITACFDKAKKEGRGAFVAYLAMGAPTPGASERAADALLDGGADILELGVPFSDPFADGATIRSAAYQALAEGVTLDGVLAMASRIRSRHPEAGLVLFTYYNLVFSKGLDEFASAVAAAGIDAVLAVDLPLEEREELLSALRPHGVGYVPLVAPNTPLERVAASAEGLEDTFVYAITVKGITGAREKLPEELSARLDAIRSAVRLPVAAGFGISTKAQAEEVSRHADGFVVGSALVRRLMEEGTLAPPFLP